MAPERVTGRNPWAAALVGARDLAFFPARVAVAATRTTLQLGTLAAPEGPIRRTGGYADMVLRTIGEGGYAEQLTVVLTDDAGPMRLASTIADLTSPDRPLGRILMRGGVLDRLLADDGPLVRIFANDGALERLLAPDGPIDRLTAGDGALERLFAEGGAIDRLLAEGGALDQLVTPNGVLDRLLKAGGAVDRLTETNGVLDRVLAPGGLADRILTEDGFLEKLVADGGTLDQLVGLGTTLEAIRPRLAELAEVIPSLSHSAESLSRAVGPLGELAGRLPLSRRKSIGAAP